MHKSKYYFRISLPKWTVTVKYSRAINRVSVELGSEVQPLVDGQRQFLKHRDQLHTYTVIPPTKDFILDTSYYPLRVCYLI